MVSRSSFLPNAKRTLSLHGQRWQINHRQFQERLAWFQIDKHIGSCERFHIEVFDYWSRKTHFLALDLRASTHQWREQNEVHESVPLVEKPNVRGFAILSKRLAAGLNQEIGRPRETVEFNSRKRRRPFQNRNDSKAERGEEEIVRPVQRPQKQHHVYV